MSRPATLRLHLTDLLDAPLAGAAVVLAGRGLQTDANGDAVWQGLTPGEAVVTARAEGYASALRTVELAEGDAARLWMILPPVGAELSFDARSEVLVEDGHFRVELRTGDLLDWAGDVYQGEALLRWTWLGAAAPHGPGPRIGLDERDEEVGLDLVATLTVEAFDEDGTPLRLRPGAAMVLSAAEPTGDEGGEETTLWRLDPARGRWRWEAETTASDGSLSGDVSAFGTWAFATPRALGGLALSTGCPSLDTLPVDVRVSDGLTTVQVALTSLQPDAAFAHLPADLVEASLVVNDAVLSTVSVEAAPGGARDPTPIDLSPCEGLGLAFQTEGDCAAEAVRVQILEPDGTALYSGTAPTPFLHIPSPGEGPLTLRIRDSDGATFSEERVDLEEGELNLRVVAAPEDRRRIPEGGCAPAPCLEGSCEGCLALSLYGADGLLATSGTLWLGEPAGGSASVDSAGEACVASVAGAAQGVLSAEGLLGVAGIPAGGRCEEPERCASMSLWTGAETLPCAEDSQVISFLATELGFAEPWASRDEPLAWPGRGLGQVSLQRDDGEVVLGSRELPKSLRCEGAYAVVLQQESAAGLLSPGATEIRCLSDEGTWIVLSLETALSTAGTQNLGDTGGAARLSLALEDEATGASQRSSALAGQVEVWVLSEAWIGLNLDVRLPGSVWSGSLVAPLLSAADAPRLLGDLRARELRGAWVGLRGASGADPRRYGPSGVEPLDLIWPTTPTLAEFCLSEGSSASAYGLDLTRGDARPPFLASLSLDHSLTLEGNAEPASAGLIPSALAWVRDDLVRTLYEQNGHDPFEALEGATILGKALTEEDGALVPMGRFGTVTLEAPDGTRLTGERLSDDLRVGAVGAEGWFIFFGVPPAEPDAPYTLVLEDPSGAEVEAFTQQVAPVAGGVMLVGL